MSIASVPRLRDRAAGFCRCVLCVAALVSASPSIAAPSDLPPAAGMAAEATAEAPPARWTAVPAKPFPRATDDSLTRALAGHRGHPVLVHFWASWCPPCRTELPEIRRLATSAEARGLRVLTVAVADRQKAVADLLQELGVDLPVIHDPEQSISRAWSAWGLPTSVLLDGRHRVRYRAVGVVDWSGEPTRAAVAKVMSSGRPPVVR